MLMIKVTSIDEVTQGVIKGGEEFKAPTQDTPKIQRSGRKHRLPREAVMENLKDKGKPQCSSSNHRRSLKEW